MPTMTIKVPPKKCHIAKDCNSQNWTMDYVVLSYYILNLEWPMSFISCNKHKDGSIFKFGAQSNAFKMIEK
jgi:hypothetical protein